MLLSSILSSRDGWLSSSETIDAFLNNFFESFSDLIYICLWISLESFFGVYFIVELYSSIEIETELILAMRDKGRDRDAE